jgi:hypothetical protein
MSYVLFVSYARLNTKHDKSAEAFRKFLNDLEADLVNRVGLDAGEEWSFLDARDIELGAPWPNDLAQAVVSSRMCLAFYSKPYFVSDWCGKEFEVFRQRRARIIPVLWGPPVPEMPQVVTGVEYVNDDFPKEYRDKGLRQLILQEDRSRADYQECVRLFGEFIATQYERNNLQPTGLTLLPSIPHGNPQARPKLRRESRSRRRASYSLPVEAGIGNRMTRQKNL